MSSQVPNPNAFRVLGLPSSASDAEIALRGKQLLSLIKVGESPAYPTDLDAGDSKLRSEALVRSALDALRDKQASDRHRLFWYSPSASSGLSKATVSLLYSGKTPGESELASVLREIKLFAQSLPAGSSAPLLHEAEHLTTKVILAKAHDDLYVKRVFNLAKSELGPTSATTIGKAILSHLDNTVGSTIASLPKMEDSVAAVDKAATILAGLSAEVLGLASVVDVGIQRRIVAHAFRRLSIHCCNELDDLDRALTLIASAAAVADDPAQVQQLRTDREALVRMAARTPTRSSAPRLGAKTNPSSQVSGPREPLNLKSVLVGVAIAVMLTGLIVLRSACIDAAHQQDKETPFRPGVGWRPPAPAEPQPVQTTSEPPPALPSATTANNPYFDAVDRQSVREQLAERRRDIVSQEQLLRTGERITDSLSEVIESSNRELRTLYSSYLNKMVTWEYYEMRQSEHNLIVNQYNEVVSARTALLEKYHASVEAFNVTVDSLNRLNHY
jgi:hypothetical protein